MHYVYLLKCGDGSLYCGVTNNVTNRLEVHNSGKGSKYVRSRGGGIIVYTEQLPNKSEALKREIAIKKMSKIKKEALTMTFLH